MESDDARFAAIAARIAPGASLVRRWPLEGGVSARVDALEIVHPDGSHERLVLRRHGAIDWKPLEADVTTTEFGVLTVLAHAGFPLPAPRLLDVSGSTLSGPYMVMDFVDGSTDVSSDELPGALRKMATFLARLHALNLDTVAGVRLPHRDDPTGNTMRYLPDTSLGKRIRAAHEEHGPVVATNPPVLLHGDFWPGNILWRDGEIAAVIDWEDAAIGDPVADLASSRLELLWKYGQEAMARFTAHYQALRPIDLTNLPFWEISSATGASALMGEWGLDPAIEADMRAKASWLTSRALDGLVGEQGESTSHML